jgi:hypothetical protein
MRRSTASSSWHGSAWLALGLLAVGCGGGRSNASLACLPALSRECTPLYDPTFDMIFKNRIGPTCGAVTTGSSCHAEKGARGGLVMQTAAGLRT